MEITKIHYKESRSRNYLSAIIRPFNMETHTFLYFEMETRKLTTDQIRVLNDTIAMPGGLELFLSCLNVSERS